MFSMKILLERFEHLRLTIIFLEPYLSSMDTDIHEPIHLYRF